MREGAGPQDGARTKGQHRQSCTLPDPTTTCRPPWLLLPPAAAAAAAAAAATAAACAGRHPQPQLQDAVPVTAARCCPRHHFRTKPAGARPTPPRCLLPAFRLALQPDRMPCLLGFGDAVCQRWLEPTALPSSGPGSAQQLGPLLPSCNTGLSSSCCWTALRGISKSQLAPKTALAARHRRAAACKSHHGAQQLQQRLSEVR